MYLQNANLKSFLGHFSRVLTQAAHWSLTEIQQDLLAQDGKPYKMRT